MTRVQLIDVTKRFGSTLAVDSVTADIADGEFVTLLGPSGCGKTTTLRMVAGLVDPTVRADHVRRSGREQRAASQAEHRSGVPKPRAVSPPERRPEHRVWVRGQGHAESGNSASGAGNAPNDRARPARRSHAGAALGGQQQRVALARMLATDPRVLLFDEPLSALDRNLRDTLKYSILDLQRRTGKTAIYVTHDQSEAFAISDRIFVMNEGRIEQAGTQLDIYLRPRTEFVAGFVGDNNAISGEVVGLVAGAPGESGLVDVRAGRMRLRGLNPGNVRVGDKVLAFVRPENIEVMMSGGGVDEPNLVRGRIDQIVFEGPTVRLIVDADGIPIKATAGGLGRLTLLDQERRDVVLRLQEVTVVRDEPAIAA